MRPRVAEQPAEIRVQRIAAREPNDLPRRSEPLQERRHKVALAQELDEITVLGDDDGGGGSRGGEDGGIVGVLEAEFTNRYRGDATFGFHPPREGGRELGVKPNGKRRADHGRVYAARIGWSSRRLANRRQAVTSAGSRSGSSSTTCSGVNPVARRSSTSITRIRIPRTQGLSRFRIRTECCCSICS